VVDARRHGADVAILENRASALSCSSDDGNRNEREPTGGRKMLVGASGFEPEASCAQGRRATRLRYAPTGSTQRL
jgi:hypothetical protein